MLVLKIYLIYVRFYGVMVSTLDSESSDPSSNLGRTFLLFGDQYLQTKFVQNLCAQRGARTHDPEIKSLMLYRLS
jgi:hypothetical protein